MSAVILHLSDIHIRSSADPILKRGFDVARATYALLPNASAVIVVVSGDIAFSGAADQYEWSLKFLQEIRDEIRRERDVPIYFIPCPGNHDCDFSKEDSTRKFVLEAIKGQSSDKIDDSIIGTCTRVQENYFSFEARMTEDVPFKRGDALWKSYEIDLEGKRLTFDSLNVAWASQLHEQPNLVFPHIRYESKVKEQPDIRITVLHQPLNWFGQATYRPFRQFLRGLANIVMTGHEHVGVFGENTDSDSGSSAYIEGWVLQGERDLSDSSFGVIELDLQKQTYRATKYQWHSGMYQPSDEGSWEDYRSLPTKQRNPLAISSEFLQALHDPGGNFQSALGDEVTLEDLFVFPDMQSRNEEDSGELHRASVLRDAQWLKQGVLLEGDEKVGATSLLYRLFEIHHGAGLLPLYLKGTNLRNASERDLELAVRRAIEGQYGQNALAHYEQTPRKKRVLLLDDFDESPVKSSQHRFKVLDYLIKRFGYVVITVDELFATSDLFTAPEMDCLKNFRRFRLLPFGYSRRSELVRRWFQIAGRDGTIGEEEFLAKCDSAERLFDSVIVRNIIPALPLYFLTLLQGVDSGATRNFQESALGQYYGFLLTKSLQNAGIPPNRLDSYIHYCSHLAWHFHGSNVKELDRSQLEQFNDKFRRDEHSVDFDTRIDELLRARILSKSGDYYRFRYPYIYYYVKGRYIASRLDDLEVQAYVKRCCKHLYARENANTLLFLAHHAYADNFFISCIVEALNLPFAGRPEIRFDGEDTKHIAALVSEAPKLVYSGESPENHRERTNEEKDKLGDVPDGLSDAEEGSDDLSLLAQLASTAKTVEILGQILKNQFAVYSRERRVSMLQQLMRGPLRGIRALLDELTGSQDLIIAELEEHLERKAHITDPERRSSYARRIMAHLLQISAFGFIQRTAISINSRDLADDIRTAANSISSPAAQLIELAVRLDSPDPLPRALIKKLITETRTDIVGGNMVRLIVLERLYMFRADHEDKHWLGSLGIIELQKVKSVSYKGRDVRKL
jgi:hypothetical protein